MKRLAAIFLVFCLLLSGVSVAEEVAKEQRFLSGLLALLQSVDLSRDMLTLNADYEGRNVFSGKLKGQDGVTDLSISAEGLALQAQLSEEEIAASLNGNTAVLRFEDVRALAGTAQAALAGLSPEMENIQALLQLFLTHRSFRSLPSASPTRRRSAPLSKDWRTLGTLFLSRTSLKERTKNCWG